MGVTVKTSPPKVKAPKSESKNRKRSEESGQGEAAPVGTNPGGEGEYHITGAYFSMAVAEVMLHIMSAVFVGVTWSRYPNEPIKAYMSPVTVYMQVVPGILVLAILLAVPIWRRSKNPWQLPSHLWDFVLASVLFGVVYAAPWAYWGMLLQLPGPLFCPPKILDQTIVWMIFSTMKGSARVFLKLEFLNPTGSYKDRMARAVIEEAERQGTLKPGMTVVEATGGSTGSSLALVCAVKRYKFRVISSDAFAKEKLRTMAAFGSDLDLIASANGKITPDLIPSMREKAKEFSKEDGVFWVDQFSNADVLVGYQTLGHELVQQFPDGIDAFCGAVGGGGMVMGVSKILKKKYPQTRIVVLEPESAPMITKGHGGSHSVEGIGIGFMPPLLDKNLYDEAKGIPEAEAREMCRRLAKEEGILVGTSSGLNVMAALELAKQLGPGKTVVTVACDTGLKYMNSGLFG
ncbi:hypothetical protein CEP53_001187 [Fusarium sp. AF-6]|nr:hypothetical protein CEP53_001187 [Fusarium sp. AF-6]